MALKLLSTGNPKTLKGESVGYMTFILHLAPADISGYEVCPKRSKGCTLGCLNMAGRGGMFKIGETTNIIQKARIRKTKYFFEFRHDFMWTLLADITLAIKQAHKQNLIPAIRLNGTSDISWEKYLVPGTEMNIFQYFSDVIFYDYTKVLGRKVSLYPNYSITFSESEDNQADVLAAIKQGLNVATVFGTRKGVALPEMYHGLPVFNGDESDLRFLDPKGVIVGLYAKGKAKKDTSGFVKYPTFNIISTLLEKAAK